MSREQVAKMVFNRAAIARSANVAALAQSTSDFDSILADTIGKTLRQAYVEVMPTWTLWAREAFAPDFKTISRTQLGGIVTPPTVSEGAEYGYAQVGDAKEVYTLAKYGEVILLTWEAIINDDLSAFNRVPQMLGAAAARLEDDLCYAVLTANAAMSDGVALFDAAHANVTTAVISVTSLGAGRALLRKQTGLSGNGILNLQARHLIVPAALETLAEQTISSVVDPAKSNATPNPFANRLQVVAEPRLDATSALIWYLAADTSQVDTLEVCFLEGNRQPVLDENEGYMVDGRSWKVRHVVASKAIDWRGMVRSSGA
jgi:hypothetical protein